MADILLHTEQKQEFSQRNIQSVEILQMNTQQLESYLNSILLENPLVDPDASYNREEEPMVTAILEDEWNDTGNPRLSNESVIHYDNLLPQAALTLSQQLYIQLLPYVSSAGDERVYRYLIDCLDENGYLPADILSLCDSLKLTTAQLENYIRTLQQLEPAGIGARSLKECLLLQLDRLSAPRKKLAVILASHHLQDIADNRIRSLAKELGERDTAVVQAIELIRSLNPKPLNGLSFHENRTYIRPDIIVEHNQNGFKLRLRQARIHRLVTDSNYLALVNGATKEVQDYIKKKNQDILWLNCCLDQRESTLMRLAQEIVLQQTSFFKNGPGYLHPMDQSDMSHLLQVNDSTISRAIRDKYLQCFWGIFPLKYFFPRAGQDGSSMTVDQIKVQIQELVKSEDRHHPLSDKKISDLLAQFGITLSRRTVAKYRVEMNIPDTSHRRAH